MQICNTINQWQDVYKTIHNKSIGFVPTMGHLHAGHMSLVSHAKKYNDITVVSIFVNPTQFNNQEDFQNYPKTMQDDIDLLKKYEVDYLFCPTYDEIYPDQYTYSVSENKISKILEGEHRPGHFDGMLTIVLKLLNIIRPTRLVMCEKDYQQAQLVKNMIEAFFIATEIDILPTYRLNSGLPYSSRNSNLSKENSEKAFWLSKLLKSNLSNDEIKTELTNLGFKVEYVEDYDNRKLAAAWLGNVRLIDNVSID